MARTSLRQKRIRWLKSTLKRRLKFRFLRELFGFRDEIQDTLDEVVAGTYTAAVSRRYHQDRSQYRSRRSFVFEEDLQDEVDESGKLPWLNDVEFQQKYRCARSSFEGIYNLIKDDPVFATRNGTNGRQQLNAKMQLLVLLKYLGTEGSGGSNADLRNLFGIGEGTANLYRNRVVEALLNLKDQVITWPNPEERKEIATRIMADFKWPNCVAIIDGTLFPLAFRPQSHDAPDYSGRKFAYSISAIIVCDDQRRIRYINAGWPGTVHDNRILRNSKISQQAELFFSEKEYMFGDSAFENSWFLVSAFKKPRNAELPREQELFNDNISPLRVVSEHTNGILKGRFPWLRSIRNIVSSDPEDMKKILMYVHAACILHNLLLECEIPDEWIDRDDITDIDDPDRAWMREDDELNIAVPAGASNDIRREQLVNYMLQIL